MKKGYVFLTAVFIMGILVMTNGQATAAWRTVGLGGNTLTSVAVLSNANPSGLYTAKSVDDPVYQLVSAEAGMAIGSIITLTLTGGAVWTSPLPTAVSSPTGVNFTSFGSPAGTASIQFVSSTTTAGVWLSFSTSAGGINVLNAGSNVDLTFKLETPTGTVITPATSLKSVASYLFEPKPCLVIGNVVKEATVDVMSLPAYSKFENASLVGGQAANGLTFYNNFVSLTGSIPGATLTTKKVLFTLSGDFTGVTKVTMPTAGASVLTGCDNALSTTSGLPGQFLINAAKTEAYATNTATMVGTVSLPIDCSPIFYVDGTTVQSARSFTAKVENIIDGANYVAATWQSPLTNYKFVRNGTFFSANSIGTYNTVKVSDLSGSVPLGGAKVLINAWDAAGVRLAEASGLTDVLVQNNQTITLTGDQIAARFVGTPMKYEFAVQSKNSVISNVKKTPDGFGSNVYTNTTGGGSI